MKTDNELIAEFMGGVPHDLDDGFGNIRHVIWFKPGNNPNPHCGAGTYKRPDELEYDKRWGWLMPVVDKIERLEYEVYISSQMQSVDDDMRMIWHQDCTISDGVKTYSECSAETKIKAVYKSVVEFIKWHNDDTERCCKNV